MNQPYAAAPEPSNYNIASECLFWDSDERRSILQIRHRGYQPLAGVTHTRTFVLIGREALFIHDYLECDNDDPHDYHWALHSNEELVAAGDRTWRSDQMAVVFGSPLPLARRTRRPCMLPLAFQADMSEQQGETNEYYWHRSGGTTEFAVLLKPLDTPGGFAGELTWSSEQDCWLIETAANHVQTVTIRERSVVLNPVTDIGSHE